MYVNRIGKTLDIKRENVHLFYLLFSHLLFSSSPIKNVWEKRRNSMKKWQMDIRNVYFLGFLVAEATREDSSIATAQRKLWISPVFFLYSFKICWFVSWQNFSCCFYEIAPKTLFLCCENGSLNIFWGSSAVYIWIQHEKMIK